jgi:hypothetical protein
LDQANTPIIAEQQTTNLQGNIETAMDLWNRAMGVRFTFKYSKTPEISVQNLRLIQTHHGSSQIKLFTKTAALRKQEMCLEKRQPLTTQHCLNIPIRSWDR